MTHSPSHLSSLQQHSLIILGAGYTGLRIYQQARTAGWRVFATSRDPGNHLEPIPPKHRLHFNLTHKDTWSNIPDPAHLIWSFPAVPLDLVKAFFATRSPNKTCRMLVMGSTSAYQPHEHSISEATPLNMQIPRVQAEEHLRRNYRAVVIRLAGLYGPGRHIFDWIRKGKIQNTNKFVNFLHVEDAAAICLQALERASDGSTYLASDGHPRTWEDICFLASSKWQIPIPAYTPTQHHGKQVSCHKLQTELQYVFRFPDLFDALHQIECNG